MNSLHARWVRFYARTEPEINLELCARVEMHRVSWRVCTRELIFPRQTKVTLVRVAAARHRHALEAPAELIAPFS
jgi:hypothetical protein